MLLLSFCLPQSLAFPFQPTAILRYLHVLSLSLILSVCKSLCPASKTNYLQLIIKAAMTLLASSSLKWYPWGRRPRPDPSSCLLTSTCPSHFIFWVPSHIQQKCLGCLRYAPFHHLRQRALGRSKSHYVRLDWAERRKLHHSCMTVRIEVYLRPEFSIFLQFQTF